MERAEESFRQGRFVARLVRRRRLTLWAAVLMLALASLLAYAKGRRAAGPYALADDCPRGALVYAQASDLPELLRLWDSSRLKERYLASTSFKQFADGHVALKLVARAGEFGEALGFTPDAQMLSEATEKSAALAVYDIGRMELVFVAPVSEEKVLAARLFQNADSFEKTELPDGTAYYARDVEADRGRQKQKILFAFLRGRFVLATDERLMLRTLANVNGKARADRLSDDPSFKTLSRELAAPHLAAVWVDQTRLNADYYFKHYWAMADASTLKGIRAGLFDFEAREGSWLERREFLLEGGRKFVSALSPRDVQELSGYAPPEAAYVKLFVLADGGAAASSLVGNTLQDHAPEEGGGGVGGGRLHEDFDPASGGATDYSWGSDYSYLDGDYDEAIDDTSDSEEGGGSQEGDETDTAAARLEQVLGAARPSLGEAAQSPVVNDGPLFVEFRRLAVLRLDDPGRLDVRAFEESVASLAAGPLTAAGTVGALRWSDAGEGERRRRELELPMLGRRLCYALRGRDLFVSNDGAFLDSALAGSVRGVRRRAAGREEYDELTVIRLDRRAETFDGVFSKLDERRARGNPAGGPDESGARNTTSEAFFSGNVSSLLDAASPVSRIEIRRRSTPGRLREEVEMSAPGP
ncbi:MAG: hypothetical protein JOZ02_08495 [Acidobacteria bacterium]|nr:hypothetical protein [Acidobacteriota bacterium]